MGVSCLKGLTPMGYRKLHQSYISWYLYWVSSTQGNQPWYGPYYLSCCLQTNVTRKMFMILKCHSNSSFISRQCSFKIEDLEVVWYGLWIWMTTPEHSVTPANGLWWPKWRNTSVRVSEGEYIEDGSLKSFNEVLPFCIQILWQILMVTRNIGIKVNYSMLILV